MTEEFYQVHSIGPYRAKVIIEWSFPESTSDRHRGNASQIAESILSNAAPQLRGIVEDLRGERS